MNHSIFLVCPRVLTRCLARLLWFECPRLFMRVLARILRTNTELKPPEFLRSFHFLLAMDSKLDITMQE